MKKPYNKPFVKIRPTNNYTRLLARYITNKLGTPEIQNAIHKEIFNTMVSCKS